MPLQELDIRPSPMGKQQEKPLSQKPETKRQHREEAIRDSQLEDPWMGEPFEKNQQQQEGDRTTSQGESKDHQPPRTTGSSSSPGFDPNTPKGGGAEAREGCYPGGERNKASS